MSDRNVIGTNEDAPTVYANNLLVQVSVWDFKLAFGQVIEVDDDALIVRAVVNVMLSPQHAKAVLEILSRQVEQYEANYGTIPSDPRPAELTESPPRP